MVVRNYGHLPQKTRTMIGVRFFAIAVGCGAQNGREKDGEKLQQTKTSGFSEILGRDLTKTSLWASPA